jgi:hypothetical protein
MEKLGGESTGQIWMEVENQEGQGPLWAVVPLMMVISSLPINVWLSALENLHMLPVHSIVLFENTDLE